MNENLKKIILYLRMIFPVLFIVMGVYVLLNIDQIELNPTSAKVFGYATIIYGIFRGYRVVKSILDFGKTE